MLSLLKNLFRLWCDMRFSRYAFLEKINNNYFICFGFPSKTYSKSQKVFNTYYNLEGHKWTIEINDSTKIKDLGNAMYLLSCVSDIWNINQDFISSESMFN